MGPRMVPRSQGCPTGPQTFPPSISGSAMGCRLPLPSVLVPYTPQGYTYTLTWEGGMKAKLTVTIDEELIPEAKEQARSQGLSLSGLIERALRGLTLEKRQSFSARWRGGFKAARRKDDRYKALAEKYL